jgi:hypothetical protein
MKAYTKEEKKEYYQNLQAKWKANKEKADGDPDARARFEAIMAETNGKFSYYSFYFTLCNMQRLGYEGNPYVDTKTFKGWKDAGFMVKKGEKSQISGITWLSVTKDKEGNEDNTEFIYPKEYHLFHRLQVEPIK